MARRSSPRLPHPAGNLGSHGTHEKEVVQQLAEDCNLPIHKVEKLLNGFLKIITEDLAATGRSEVPGLEVFGVTARPAHKTTHPQTGQPVNVPKRVVVRYRSARELRRHLNPKTDAHS